MSNEVESSRSRYFRLLKKGEQRKTGDLEPKVPHDFTGVLQQRDLEELKNDSLPVGDDLVLRPVQVDEWISYAERKPTKEDFEPTGEILVLRDGWPFIYHMSEISDSPHLWFGELFWRRITPPQPAKPKSVELEVRDCKGDLVRATPLPNGNIKLADGTEVHTNTFDKLVELRRQIMSK